MQYKEKILALLSDSENAYFDWLKAQPKILQPDIIREFKLIVSEIFHDSGIKNQDDKLELLDIHAEQYEQNILDEHVEAVNKQLALATLIAKIQQLEQTATGIRDYVKNCITAQTADAKAMRYMAKTMMALEKKNSIYNADNWAEIF